MIRLLIIVILALVPLAARAQPLAVQTGEHASFSRVVVRLPATRSWTFGRNVDGYVLRLDTNDGYDLRRFYDLIPRTRIAAVAQDSATGSLFLTVTCACKADVTELTNGFVVVDIMDGAPDPDAPFERVIDAPFVTLVAPARAVPLLTPRRPAAIVPALNVDFPVSGPLAPRAPMQPSVPDELGQLEKLIVAGIGQALTDGALTRGPSVTAHPSIATGEPSRGGWPGISVSTGLDPAARVTAAPDSDAVCFPDERIDTATWSDDRPFSVQLADRRAALVPEFDALDPDNIDNLARLYLSFGFGREAAQTLDLHQDDGADRAVLRVIAAIIEGDPVRWPSAADQTGCAGRIAMWAFLAATDPSAATDVDHATVLRGYRELGVDLQQRLGPRIAQGFILRGDADSARQVLSLARGAAVSDAPRIAAAAALDLITGNDDRSFAVLNDLVTSDPRTTPDTMLLFMTEATRLRHPVSAQNHLAADALRFEYADHPIASDLAEAQFDAHLFANNFESAATLLAGAANNMAQSRLRAMRIRYLQAAVVLMPDAAFLSLAFAPTTQFLSDDVQISAARRLVLLGFPKTALGLLSTVTRPDDDSVRQLRAIALLALGNVAQAEATIGNVSASRGAAVSDAARALSLGVAPDIAALLNGEVRLDDWRTGNWAALAGADDPLLRDASTAFLDSPVASPDAAMSLAGGRDLLAQADATRAIIDGLLSRFSVAPEF